MKVLYAVFGTVILAELLVIVYLIKTLVPGGG